MRQRVVGTVLAVSFIACVLGVQSAAATSQSVVISGVQLGAATSATHEFISLYNNGDEDVDITNWCVYYASASSLAQGSRLGCFAVENNTLHVFMPAKMQAFLVSSQLKALSPLLGSDLVFSATLSGTAGHIRVIDAEGQEQDKLGWGITAASPEATAAPTAPNGQVLMRKLVIDSVDLLQDTDNNADDFVLATPLQTYAYGALYEVQDVCANIAGIQTELPDTFAFDDEGQCVPPPVDQCTNIDGMQAALPEGYVLSEFGECVDVDVCHNVPGVQLVVPQYYVVSEFRYCALSLPVMTITELLANPEGDDEGNEYIEVFNPNNEEVVMDMYRLIIGNDDPKTYAFPEGTVIPAGAYMRFSDDDISFTLVNSTSTVKLVDNDGLVIASSEYADPPVGSAWALIGDVWQYTNVPTPGLANVANQVDTEFEEEVIGLKPCAPNQYRSPETNRCRLLVAAGSSLTPCRDDQYRSEETNRCRSIAATTSALAPCGSNQERNPDTNRCRNVVTSVPTVPFAVEPIADTAQATFGWWALGGVGIIALAYGTWEWRSEIAKASRRLAGFFTRSK